MVHVWWVSRPSVLFAIVQHFYATFTDFRAIHLLAGVLCEKISCAVCQDASDDGLSVLAARFPVGGDVRAVL